MNVTPHQFAELMQKELDANAEKKGEWERWKPSPSSLIHELNHHMNKLMLAIADHDPDKIRENAADVGNNCMKAVEMACSLVAKT